MDRELDETAGERSGHEVDEPPHAADEPRDGSDAEGDGESDLEVTAEADDTSNDDARPHRSRWRTLGRWTLRAAGILVVLVLLATVIPVSSSGLDARPEPAASYEDAVERLDAVAADEDQLGVVDQCRSRRFVHGEATPVAIVLFHGLTNCPAQFVEFAQHLYDEGANVIVMRAPHHGLAGDDGEIGPVSKVGSLSARELRDFADDAVDVAVGLGDRVEVLGLSMGGVLAMWTGEFRSDVDLAVAVAPAISIPGVPHFLTTAFVNLFNRLPNLSLPSSGVELDHTYAGESTGALSAMFLLARATENELTSGRSAADRVVVVLNPDDEQVDNSEVRQLVERWEDGDGRVEIVELPPVGLPHDVIDPDQPEGDIGLVYPLLFDLLE